MAKKNKKTTAPENRNARFVVGARVGIQKSEDSLAEDFEGGTGTILSADECGADVAMDNGGTAGFYFSNLYLV